MEEGLKIQTDILLEDKLDELLDGYSFAELTQFNNELLLGLLDIIDNTINEFGESTNDDIYRLKADIGSVLIHRDEKQSQNKKKNEWKY